MDDAPKGTDERAADSMSDLADDMYRMGFTEAGVTLEDQAILLYGKAIFPDEPEHGASSPPEPPDDEEHVSMRLPEP